MKLKLLLEGAIPRHQILAIQQELIDELDDDGFEVDLGVDKVLIRHPLLRQPLKLSLTDPDRVKFYAQECGIDHPRFIEGIARISREKVMVPQVKDWLLTHGFTVADRKAVEEKHNVMLWGGGFQKGAELYYNATVPQPIAVKLGYDSYKNPQHEYWLLSRERYTVNKTQQGHRIHTLDQMINTIGDLV